MNILTDIDVIKLGKSFDAALYFTRGNSQYLFHWRENGVAHNKFVSSAAVRTAFLNEAIDSGWLAPQVCRCGVSNKGEWFVAVIPSGLQTITIVNGNAQLEQFNVPLPKMLFMGVGLTYYVWAVDDAKFSKDSSVYVAPLPNVNKAGDICWGENSPEKANPGDVLKMWKLFVESVFNGHSVQNKSKGYPADVRELLIHLHQTGTDEFPIGELCPVNQYNSTAGSVINGILRQIE